MDKGATEKLGQGFAFKLFHDASGSAPDELRSYKNIPFVYVYL